jgi:hypothetical protein
MRGSRPGLWKQYDASQLSVAAACMTHTRRTAPRTAAVTPAYQAATRPIVPPASCVFVVGPTIGSLNGRRVFHP